MKLLKKWKRMDSRFPCVTTEVVIVALKDVQEVREDGDVAGPCSRS